MRCEPCLTRYEDQALVKEFMREQSNLKEIDESKVIFKKY